MFLDGKRILITGGTGSLGRRVVDRVLTGEMGRPEKICIFSRDEAKQHEMRLFYLKRRASTDEVIYATSQTLLSFYIGDMRDYPSLVRAVVDADVIVHAAALKQVPTCEYFPFQAVRTNIIGAQNLVRAIRENLTSVEAVIGVSTDKACKPINVMGMTKALQERIFIETNMSVPQTRFVCVRYGNVLASRGSVIPLFLEQISEGGPVTITVKEMTRLLLSLDRAVDAVFAAMRSARPGETYIPRVPAARVTDVARVLMNGHPVPIVYTGIRPGEKIHEILVAEEECHRTVERDGYYVICPLLPELQHDPIVPAFRGEFSSARVTAEREALRHMLAPFVEHQLLEAAV